MLKSLMEKREALMARFAKIEESQIQDAELRSKFRSLKAKQGGFTLLELLVVVAILAAIAGTATIALQDTDARASAAAHVAMMDELNKGIRTFRVLNKNALPNNFDSLMVTNTANVASAAVATLLPNGDGDVLATDSVAAGPMVAGVAGAMADIGMSELRYIISDTANPPEDVTGGAGGGCEAANLQTTIASRGNAVVAGNIFNGQAGNGCGQSITLDDASQVAYWSSTVERLLGPGAYGNAAFSGTAMTSTSSVPAGTQAPVLLAVGFGPSSNLFDANSLGGLTSVPVYRHVSEQQYNRFIGMFHVANATTTGVDVWAAPVAKDQVSFAGIVDGAGDTKEEELGEWDGTRNTI